MRRCAKQISIGADVRRTSKFLKGTLHVNIECTLKIITIAVWCGEDAPVLERRSVIELEWQIRSCPPISAPILLCLLYPFRSSAPLVDNCCHECR